MSTVYPVPYTLFCCQNGSSRSPKVNQNYQGKAIINICLSVHFWTWYICYFGGSPVIYFKMFFFLLKTALLRYKSQTMKFTSFKYTIQWGLVFSELCNHYHNTILGHFLHPISHPSPPPALANC